MTIDAGAATLLAGRSFQLWEYRASHGQLLIRSPADDLHDRYVDILFAGVRLIMAPRHLGEIQIVPPSAGDLEAAGRQLGEAVIAEDLVVLRGPTQNHYVVAARAWIADGGDSQALFESPFDVESTST